MTAAHYATLMMAQLAGDVWRMLPPPQQAALVGALEATRAEAGDEVGCRITVKVHARVAAALRTSGLVAPLSAERGRRDLTLPGLMVREHGLELGRSGR